MELRLGIFAEHAGATERMDGRNGEVWSCKANYMSETKGILLLYLGGFSIRREFLMIMLGSSETSFFCYPALVLWIGANLLDGFWL